MSLIDFRRKIAEAVAQGWCVQPNTGKTFDGDLATAITDNVERAFIPAREPGFALDRIEQVAMYVPDMDAAKASYARLGMTTWHDDTVTGVARVRSGRDRNDFSQRENKALLSFNYDLGIEFELIRYIDGDNWHQQAGRINRDGSCERPFSSHMSYHVEDVDAARRVVAAAGFDVAQEVQTIGHTNPYLIEKGRKFHYVVFNSRHLLGWDIKLIKRIEGKA